MPCRRKRDYYDGGRRAFISAITLLLYARGARAAAQSDITICHYMPLRASDTMSDAMRCAMMMSDALIKNTLRAEDIGAQRHAHAMMRARHAALRHY